MSFLHPLAKKTKIWPVVASHGGESNVLVVVTTLVLDPKHEGYKKKLVDRLSQAAADHLAASQEADAYVLINRMRDWG